MSEEIKTKILIVGGGKGGEALLRIFFGIEAIEIVGIVDVNPQAVALNLAQKLGIKAGSDYKEFIAKYPIDEIINVTGSEEVQNRLIEESGEGMEVIGGHTAKFVWDMLDMHVQKEKELRYEKEKLDIIFNSVLTGIALIDANTRTIVDVNPLAIQMIGAPKSDIIGKHCHKFICPSEKNKCPVLDLGVDVNQSECVLITVDCEIIPILKTVRKISVGERLFLVESFVDISDRKKAELALQKSAAIKAEFTSMVSHELRTPLGPISEGVSIVLDGMAGDINQDQKDLLETVKRNAERLNRLVSNILDFQKLELGMAEFDFQENDLVEVLEEVCETMKLIAEKKGLYLDFEVIGDIPKVVFDRDKITQVASNIINNSIKFTDKGGIKVKLARKENIVQITIADTGPGIKEKDMDKLFQSFQQLDERVEKRTGGSGLGLAISKQIISQHKGKIWAVSKYGQGSEFFFLLPIKERRG